MQFSNHFPQMDTTIVLFCLCVIGRQYIINFFNFPTMVYVIDLVLYLNVYSLLTRSIRSNTVREGLIMASIPVSMKALVKESPTESYVLKDVPVPKPGEGELLLKVNKVAICGSDIALYKWGEGEVPRTRVCYQPH